MAPTLKNDASAKAPRGSAVAFEPTDAVGKSERWKTAALAERYYESKQYEGLWDWYAKKPLRLRKPRIIVPLFRTTINRLASFIWGGSRLPIVSVVPNPSTPDDDIGPVIEDEDAKQLSSFVQVLIEAGRLERCMIEVTKKALTTSSCAAILGVTSGNIVYQVESGKHCTPTFSKSSPNVVEKLEIVYHVEQDEPNAAGTITKKKYWYRRIVSSELDVTYNLVPYVKGRSPNWDLYGTDPEKTYKHGFGFCPVVWFRTIPTCDDPIDGRMVIDPELFSMVDRLNYGLSMRDRAMEFFSDPQWIRKGVSRGEREALAKTPGNVWDLEKDAEVSIVEMTGAGQDAVTEHLKDLRQRWCEAVGVVIDQNDNVRGDISGVVLEYLYAPMIALTSELRLDLGNDGYLVLINMLLRMTASIIERGEDLFVNGARAATKLMQAAQLGGPWQPFRMRIEWAPFFAPSATDIFQRVQATTTAVQGGLISGSTGTTAMQAVFPVKDLETEREAIEKEKAEQGELMSQMSGVSKAWQTRKAGTGLPKGKQGSEKPGKA